MAKVTLDLSDDDLKNVSYGQAAKGSIKLYIYGLAGLWIMAIPSLAFQSWLWSILLIFYIVVFVAFWILRVEKQSRMILEDLYGDIEGLPKVEREPKKKARLSIVDADEGLQERVDRASHTVEDDSV